MAYTANDLKTATFKRAFNMEVQGLLMDLQRQTCRQVIPGSLGTQRRQKYITTDPHTFIVPPRLPKQLTELKKKKPSYRQRQRNGRAGRK